MNKYIKKLINYKKSSGFSVIIVTIVILSVGLVIASVITLIVVNNLKISRDYAFATRSYYAAEGGVEDLLVRISKGLPYNDIGSIDIGTGTVDIVIEDDLVVPNQKNIIVTGDVVDRVRRLNVSIVPGAEGIAFNYAIQAGPGGFEFENNAEVYGNIYSDGDIEGANNTLVDGDLWAVGDISNIEVTNDVHGHSIDDSDIHGDAYYENGNISSTSVDGTEYPNSDPVPPVGFPDLNYNQWKADAEAGGTIYGNVNISNGVNMDYGPKKIVGNLNIENNVNINMQGPIYITGNLEISNNSVIQLDSSFGTSGSVIIVDGRIDIYNNADILGSGEDGSYILCISLSDSMNNNSPAIEAQNNVTGAVFASLNGMMVINNNAAAKALMAYKIYMKNNASVTYEEGLADLNFSSGPSSGLEVVKWKEIE